MRPARGRAQRPRPPRGDTGPGEERTANLPASGQITAISTQQRDPERVSLFLDGVFALALTREEALKRGLRVGMELTVDDVAALRAIDQISKATEAAIRLLAQRPRAEGELRTRLRQKGYDAPTIDAAVERLEGWGYLNDAAFAQTWVANRSAHRPRGRRLLAQELRQKGVDRDTIAETLDEAAIDEVAAATEAARKAAGRLSGLDEQTARRRLAGHLGRRGFDYATIRAALAALYGEREEDALAPEEE